MILRAIIFPILLFASTNIQANTMDFTGLNGGIHTYYTTYSENGITAEGQGFFSPFAASMPDDSIHLDARGTAYPTSVSFSMDRPFDAISFDYLAFPNMYRECVDTGQSKSCRTIGYQNMEVTGLRSGVEVASLLLETNEFDTTQLLDSTFKNLDSLRISLLSPFLGQVGNAYPIYTYQCDECSHLNLDSITLTPVPLPAALPMFAVGLIALYRVKNT